MTNPTTPFSWQMPQSSDLVTDLPADFETFGQAVATSMADLLGGTTGQILSKASDTDMDFTWVTNDVGDITAVTAGTGLSGGGTSGAVTVSIDTAVTADLSTTQTLANKTLTAPKISTYTTNGDLVYGTGSSVITRLGIGSSGQVLTVSGGVPSWQTAGGGSMTQLATGSLSGASVTISSISGSYKHLQLIVTAFLPASDNYPMSINFNGDSGSNYANTDATNTNGTWSNATVGASISANNDNATANGLYVINIPFYTDTNVKKFAYAETMGNNSATPTNWNYYKRTMFWNSTAAITSIKMLAQSGNMTSGTYYLYGVN